LKLGLGGIGEAFRDDNFRRYSLGSILSWISYFVQAVAVSWTTWELTHSTSWLAIIALLDAAPNVALMPLGGVIADRFDRFRVMLLSYGFAWLQAVALTWLAWAGQLTIERLAALAFLHGAIHAFSIPAQYGFLPRFVERKRLSSAISVAAAYTQLAVFAGPALAGWLILHFGVVAAYASNVVATASSSLSWRFCARLPVMSNRPRRERASLAIFSKVSTRSGRTTASWLCSR